MPLNSLLKTAHFDYNRSQIILSWVLMILTIVAYLKFFLSSYVRVLPACMPMLCPMCELDICRDQEKIVESLGTGAAPSYESPDRCWDSNLGPLQEH